MNHQKLIVKDRFFIWQPSKDITAQKVNFTGINFVIDNGTTLTIHLKDKIIKKPYSKYKTVIKFDPLAIEKNKESFLLIKKLIDRYFLTESSLPVEKKPIKSLRNQLALF